LDIKARCGWITGSSHTAFYRHFTPGILTIDKKRKKKPTWEKLKIVKNGQSNVFFIHPWFRGGGHCFFCVLQNQLKQHFYYLFQYKFSYFENVQK